jgi:hypothetical protein
MSHDLGNVGFVLTGKRCLVDAKAFASLGEGSCYEPVKPFFVAVVMVLYMDQCVGKGKG